MDFIYYKYQLSHQKLHHYQYKKINQIYNNNSLNYQNNKYNYILNSNKTINILSNKNLYSQIKIHNYNYKFSHIYNDTNANTNANTNTNTNTNNKLNQKSNIINYTYLSIPKTLFNSLIEKFNQKLNPANLTNLDSNYKITNRMELIKYGLFLFAILIIIKYNHKK
jgi:uncharacterized membrane protein